MATEGTPGPDYEILGVSLIGPPPVSAVHLQWQPGLTVLYGPNGAGKTTVLEGVQAALSGGTVEHGEAYLHIRLTDEAEPFDWGHVYFSLDLVGGIGQWIADEGFHPDPDSFQGEYFSSEELAEYLEIAVGAAWKGSPERDIVVSEVISHRTFSLLAIGNGMWKILPSIPLGTESPGLGSVLDPTRAKPIAFSFFGGNVFDPGVAMARRLAATNPPAWVPIPVAEIGTFSSWYGPEVIASTDQAIDVVTQSYLMERQHDGAGTFVMETSDTGSLVEISSQFTQTVREISERANSVINGLLPHFPGLRLDLCPPEDWLKGQLVSWHAEDQPTRAKVPLSALSEAQQRWATLAIQTALWIDQRRSYHRVMLIDEPERALHAGAAADLARELADLSGQLPVNVTTHSAAFLNLPQSRLVHVDRNLSGETEVNVITSEASHGLEHLVEVLGLPRSTALQLTRLWLVVEGVHDETFLRVLFGDELTDLRVEVLRLDGARNALSVIQSQLLMEFTEAPVLLLLDGSGADRISPVWDRARADADHGDRDEAIRHFDGTLRSLDLKRPEVAALELGKAAVIAGRWRRLNIHVLPQWDIIYYLPADEVAPGLGDWDDIEARYQIGRWKGEDIKKWLKRQHRVNISAKLIKKAASSLDFIHPDLTDLELHIRSIVQGVDER